MTHNLFSYQEWLKYYENMATDLSFDVKTNENSFRLAMLSIGLAALDSRAQQLRDSDSYMNKKLKVAGSGLIPFLKIPVSVEAAEEFADEALTAFGLSDITGLESLARQLKQTTSGRDDMAFDFLVTLVSFSKTEILAHAGAHTASEAVHVKPVVGQLISAGTGYGMMRKRLISIIDKTKAAAEKVHTRILIPIVIQNQRLVKFLCVRMGRF
jgi:hypothetical protein